MAAMARVRAFPLALVVALCGVTAVVAHSKFVCTKLKTDSSGRPVGCDGDASPWSVFTHYAGREGAQGWPGIQWDCPTNVRPDLQTINCLRDRKQRVCPGVPPPGDRIGVVRPGEAVTVAWPSNNHFGWNLTFYYEGRNAVNGGRSEPYFLDWLHQSNYIGTLSQSVPAGVGDLTRISGVTCMRYPNDANNYWHRLTNQYDPSTTENKFCWGKIRIPADARPGLNRILMYWWLYDDRGTPMHYFDCAYYWVRGTKSHNFRRASTSAQVALRGAPIYGVVPGRGPQPITDASYYTGQDRWSGHPWRQVKVRDSNGIGTWTHPGRWSSEYSG